ncbi:hypothetical protein FACS1894191_0920 [Clostridia bacterium]|nr:hypothetical protein FACS1894191_0920 [Clostridia bacterium]
METWKILVITIASAVVLGCIIGVIVGKHQLKKAQSGYSPILSLKEKIVYFLCFAVGAGCVLIGVFHDFPAKGGDGSEIVENSEPPSENGPAPGGPAAGGNVDVGAIRLDAEVA